MPRTVLFDIDNTLLYTGGAGSYGMNLAFNDLFGIPDGFARVEFSGRTDRYILETGLREHGIGGTTDEHLDRFTSRYYEILPQTLGQREGYLMPGFPQLLAALQKAGAVLGLATGNFSQAARIKLKYYGLDGYFEDGGFGEVSLDRADMVTEAIRRCGNSCPPEDILVVGDTPHDVTAALANGVIGVGVATGTYSVEELRDSGAHLVFADFSDHERAAEQLLGYASRR